MLKRRWCQPQFSLGSLFVITEVSNPGVDVVDAARERAEYAGECGERILFASARAHYRDAVLGKKLDPIALPKPQMGTDVEGHRDLALAGYCRNAFHSLHHLREVRIAVFGVLVYRSVGIGIL